MKNTKKKWNEPKLIVIVRGHPEEVLLLGCKDSTHAGDPSTGHAFCMKTTNACTNCYALSSS